MPQSDASWWALGIASYCSGQIPPARDALAKAIEMKNSEIEILLFYAMALWKSGDREGARRWYLRAMGQWDDVYLTDDWVCRLRDEAAALLGVTDPPKSTGKQESSTTRSPKP